jgi:hypothetical protein
VEDFTIAWSRIKERMEKQRRKGSAPPSRNTSQESTPRDDISTPKRERRSLEPETFSNLTESMKDFSAIWQKIKQKREQFFSSSGELDENRLYVFLFFSFQSFYMMKFQKSEILVKTIIN